MSHSHKFVQLAFKMSYLIVNFSRIVNTYLIKQLCRLLVGVFVFGIIILCMAVPTCHTREEHHKCHDGFTKKDCHTIFVSTLTLLVGISVVLAIMICYVVVNIILEQQFIETFGAKYVHETFDV